MLCFVTYTNTHFQGSERLGYGIEYRLDKWDEQREGPEADQEYCVRPSALNLKRQDIETDVYSSKKDRSTGVNIPKYEQ